MRRGLGPHRVDKRIPVHREARVQRQQPEYRPLPGLTQSGRGAAPRRHHWPENLKVQAAAGARLGGGPERPVSSRAMSRPSAVASLATEARPGRWVRPCSKSRTVPRLTWARQRVPLSEPGSQAAGAHQRAYARAPVLRPGAGRCVTPPLSVASPGVVVIAHHASFFRKTWLNRAFTRTDP